MVRQHRRTAAAKTTTAKHQLKGPFLSDGRDEGHDGCSARQLSITSFFCRACPASTAGVLNNSTKTNQKIAQKKRKRCGGGAVPSPLPPSTSSASSCNGGIEGYGSPTKKAVRNRGGDPSFEVESLPTIPVLQASETTTAQLAGSSTAAAVVTAAKDNKQRKTETAAQQRAVTDNADAKDHRKHKFRQLYLDFGQSDFAKQMHCDTCGMMYVHGVEEDIKQHLRVCKDYTHGVPFQLCCDIRIVARFPDGSKICEVRPTDNPKLRKKAAQVRAIVDKELGFAARTATSLHSPTGAPQEQRRHSSSSRKPEDYLTTYLYICSKKRVVGLASSEAIREAFLLETNYSRSTAGRRAVVGIYQIWVHSKFRGRHIASRLLDTIREKMVFGFVVPCHQVALSSPTEAGIKFARGYVKKRSSSDDVLVYDCH